MQISMLLFEGEAGSPKGTKTGRYIRLAWDSLGVV